MNSTRRRTALLVSIPLGVAILAGCGDAAPTVSGQATSGVQRPTGSTAEPSGATSASGAPTTSPSAGTEATHDPSQIMKTAKSSANNAKSAHVVGDVVDNGKTMNVDLRGQVQGKNQQATVKTQDDGTVSILTLGSDNYIKGDRTYWTKQNAPAATVALLTDKWVKAPANKSSSFEKFTLKSLLASTTKSFDSSEINSVNTSVTELTLAGQSALKLAPRLATKSSSITVTADAKNLPLQVVSDSGTVTYSEWDVVPMYAAPPASQQVQMPGGAA
ncbi:hypothetical protein [Luteipulveratus mongoliensis]|uniref:Lipoprotein n=1 Tax=Luteipulveratus mongoliensis TaxID=571913 RepID=A0A0K1JNV9_9MICO|nr:hypothetical protein [Luteipulveratus mongoliensis]AKU18401.1 hypothetical protein VV02_25390 [Luteipulveratus mongoliensis]